MTSLKVLFDWKNPQLFVPDSLLQRVVSFLILVIVNIFIGLESFGVTICDDLVRGYYHLDRDQTGWVGSAFLMGMAIAVPGCIYFCKRFTVKRYFSIGLGLFVICNFLGSICDFYSLFLALRILAGISGGMAAISSGFILTQVVHVKLHPHATALATNLAGLGFAIAQLIGGGIGQTLHWRFVFLVDVVIVFLAFILAWGTVKEIAFENTSATKLDIWGYGYYILGLIGIEIFFTQVKADWNTLGWRSDFSLVVAALVIVVFVLLIRRCRECSYAIFPKALFKNGTFVLMSITSLLMGSTIWSGTLYINILRGLFQYEHVTTGMVLSIFGFAIFVAGTLVFMMRHINPFYFIVIGLFLIGSSCFANHAETLQSSYRDIMMVLILRGLGVGMCLHPINEFVKSRTAVPLQQEAGIFLAACRLYGGVIVAPILRVVAIMRDAYHTLRFGEQVDIYSGAFRQYVRQFQLYADGKGLSWSEAAHRSKGYVIENIRLQSAVLSFDDAFFVLGVGIMIVLVSICMGEWFTRRKMVQASKLP